MSENMKNKFTEKPINNDLMVPDTKDDMILADVKDELIVSDQSEALNAVAMDTDFVKNLISQETVKNMQGVLNNRGIILNLAQVDAFIDMVRASSSLQELPDDFFEEANAGVLNNPGMYKLVGRAADIINTEPESAQLRNSVLWKV